jgi:ribonuclease G
MVDEVLIEVRPGRTRTALLGAGRLVELIVEDENRRSLVGNIYLGRVEKVVASLNAAFIDLGLAKAGFLGLAEARPAGVKSSPKESISNYLCEGDGIVVQVLRDPFEDKGPKLTARPTLSSATVVLTPGDGAIRISRTIDNPQSRTRLQNIVQGLAEQQEGFVVRTAAEEASEEGLAADISDLREAWTKLKSEASAAAPPALLLAEPDGVIRAVRDWLARGQCRVVIDEAAAYLRAKTFLEKQAPQRLERLALHQGTVPLLAAEELADDLERALASEISLPSGGTVIFSETPALIAIDVNVAGTTSAGGREQSSLKTNLEAAAEIARQIRLRNLSGLLVVDFVSMKSTDNGKKLLDALRAAVSGDPQQVFIGGFTRFGLVEMTRKRNRPSLAQALAGPCPLCAGSGQRLSPASIAYDALDRLQQEAGWQPSKEMELRCGKKIADALAGPLKEALQAVQERIGRKVTITVARQAEDGDYDIVATDRTGH